MEVEILDLGLNNLASLVRGLELAGADQIRVIENSNQAVGADLLVIPGVGAFGAAMNEIHNRGFHEVISRQKNAGDYIMGICLGMQLLTSKSEESESVQGLNLIPGEVLKLPGDVGERVPHVGWATVRASREEESTFDALNKDLDFYFVHSYFVNPYSEENLLSESNFGDKSFASGIISENVVGFQFHPEKSSHPGTQLLKNVIRWANG